MAATATKAAKTKMSEGKYRGTVSPKLRSMIQAKEYRAFIELLSRLEREEYLDQFLEQAEDYWMNVNLMGWAIDEQKGGGKAVMASIKKDWPRIWPTGLDSDRLGAFDTFSNFWERLDASKLVDSVLKEVLPDSGKEYDEAMKSNDMQMLMNMTEAERSAEILGRMGRSDMIKQYIILSQNDIELQGIGPKMAPFVARFVSIMERKVASQTENLGKTADNALIVAGALVVLLIAGFTGVLGSIWNFKLPS